MNRDPKKSARSFSVREFLLVALLSALGAFLGLFVAAGIVAGLARLGYPLGETGETFVRCLIIGLLVGFGPQLMRRWGILR